MLEIVVCSLLVNRPVRTRMLGGVGAGGEKPPATRFGFHVLTTHSLRSFET